MRVYPVTSSGGADYGWEFPSIKDQLSTALQLGCGGVRVYPLTSNGGADYSVGIGYGLKCSTNYSSIHKCSKEVGLEFLLQRWLWVGMLLYEKPFPSG